MEAWEGLLAELNPPKQQSQSNRASPDTLRQVYGDFLDVFPTSSSGWCSLLELEMGQGNQQNVNVAFGQCLLKNKSLDLWRVYIKHVKATNNLKATQLASSPRGDPAGLNAIKQAYEFTLDHLGTDISSGPLWMEYVMFLQQCNAKVLFGEVAPNNEESAKLVAVRRAFQRSVTIPTHSLESLWRDYEKFENSVNRQLAKQILNDLQGQYSTSRTIYRELKKKWEGIKVGMLATPPGATGPRGKANRINQYHQQKLWTKLIAFEKSNPLKLEKEPLSVRVELVYNQSLLCLYHFPEMWYEYAMWHCESGEDARASEVFEEACAALPTCAILHFATADFQAAREQIDEAKKIYENLVKRIGSLEPPTQGLIWIQYMRFLRRTEGASSSRKLFLRARREGCTHHVYSTSALLEWQNGKDMKVAKNIFELGLKSFLKETEYVLEYANFLVSQGDVSNARTLYERALTVVQGDDARIMWNEYLKFEYQCGDLQSTLALEKRRKEAFADLNDLNTEELLNKAQFSIGLLLLRYNAKDMLPCSESTLRHLQAVDVEEAFYRLPNLASGSEAKGRAGGGASGPSIPGKQVSADGGLPPAIADILTRLPSTRQVDMDMVDMVLQVFSSVDIKAMKAAQGDDAAGGGAGGRKRNASAMGGVNMPPKFDVYRMRQQQRQKRG